MSNRKASLNFDILQTADGSPTLSLQGGEKMHSSHGALAESLYIYKPCLEETLKLSPPRVLSVGLGLGYNELISLAVFFKKNIMDFQILSFEKHEFLRDSFCDFIKEQTSLLPQCHQQILSLVAENFQINAQDLMNFSFNALKSEKLKIMGALDWRGPALNQFNCIFYDAFSNQTDKELWSENFLSDFIDHYCTTPCFFSSYAATGNLKRVLKQKGFHLTRQSGFAHKREATLAQRT